MSSEREAAGDSNAAHDGDGGRRGWLARWTTLGETLGALCAEPSSRREAWARTTAGVVLMLVALQSTTGVLLAFYYVPSAESAHITVSFIEKQLPSGSWLRALHAHGSVWLVVALIAHLAQRLFITEGWRRRPVGWLASLVVLALVYAEGATGYSLSWDARAFYSTRVAASIAGHLPLVGAQARAWLVGGQDLSTLTVSRFYALHALVIPALMLATILARLFVFRERAAAAHEFDEARRETATRAFDMRARRGWMREQFARQAIVAALVFLALALYASKYPATLAPPPELAPAGYLPRPGAQFLWLFQMLKYLPGALASLAALLVPLFMLGGLASLAFAGREMSGRRRPSRLRRFGAILFTSALGFAALLTTIAYVEDARNPRVRQQLARQAEQEAEFRREPFKPLRTRSDEAATGNTQASGADPSSQTETVGVAPVPDAYARNCAKCHGAHGEGKSINPGLRGIGARPQRTLADIVAIIDNPRSYDLDPRMPSFARKLTEDEKREVAEWIVSLK